MAARRSGPGGLLRSSAVVSVGVIVLRRSRPDLPRGFRVPGYPVTPVVAIASCVYILAGLHWYTYAWFLLWLSVALTFYLLWGRRHSLLNRAVSVGLPVDDTLHGREEDRP